MRLRRRLAGMAEANAAFLAALDAGFIPSPQAIDEWQEVDSDEAWEELLVDFGLGACRRIRRGAAPAGCRA